MKFENYVNERMNKKQLKFIANKVEQTAWADDIVDLIRKPPVTWFEIEDINAKEIHLSTRQHGNVQDETPGRADIKEARRLLQLLKKNSSSIAKIEADTVDEWVSVYITKK